MSRLPTLRPWSIVGLVVLLGIAVPTRTTPDDSPLPLLVESTAPDQVWNEGSSAPVVSSGVIQGGLSDGTSGDGVIDTEPELASLYGDDGAAGTADDDLTPIASSEAVDAGASANLPADRFDLDGDGDTAEPLPVDLRGNLRSVDGGTGTARPDAGAYEVGSTAATDVASDALPLRTTLTAPYPNPARESVRFELRSGSHGRVRIVIYDALGREVAVAFDETLSPGRSRTVTVPTRGLASGVYVARLLAPSLTMTRQFVVDR